jgi:hypothetical protein
MAIMGTKDPPKNFDIVFLEDLYKEIEENKNIFFIRLSECYYNPLDGIFNELRRKNRTTCTDGMILYLSSEKLGEAYLQYYYKRENRTFQKTIIYSGSFNAKEMISPITDKIDNLYRTLDFNRSIHFSSNKALAEKIAESGTNVLQKLGVKINSLFEKFGRGSLFAVEVDKNEKLSRYLWDKEEVRGSIPSYFNRPSQRKIKKLERTLIRALEFPIYYEEKEYWGKREEFTIEKEVDKIVRELKTDSGALYLPCPPSFSSGKDSVFNTKRIKTSSEALIRRVSPIAITSQRFYGYPNKSKNAKIVKVAFLHRYGTYKHENKDLGEIDVHLLEPILIAEYIDVEAIPFEIITSQKKKGSKDERYKVFLIEKTKELENKETTCENKKKINVKYKGEINLIGRYDIDSRRNLEKELLGSISIETSGKSIIEIDLERGEAREEESQARLEVKENHYSLSEDILNWVLYRTSPSAPTQTPPAPFVILQVLRDVAKGYVPKHEKNKEITEDYLELIERRYYRTYHLLYDWSKRVIKSINTKYQSLTKEFEGVKLLEKKVREKLIGKEEFLDRVSTLCVKAGEGEQFTITIDFDKDNLKKLQYSWGEKIKLLGITPLKINLPIWYIIDGRDYLLLFPKSEEEKLKRLDEIKSINIIVGYKEELKSKINGKLEVNLELDIVSIEFEFCDGTRISSRSKMMLLGDVDKIQNEIEIWYNPEDVTEKLKNLAKSLMEERVRRSR